MHCCLGYDHHNGPVKDEFEDDNGIESAQADYLEVPMRKPRSKSVQCMFLTLTSSVFIPGLES